MIAVDAKGRAFVGASARGASHIRRAKPNQDAVGGFAEAGWTLIVVADGHGSERCFRSDRGSRFVVEAVKEACLVLVANRSANEIEASEFLALSQRTVESWRARVKRDADSDFDSSFVGADLFEAYGSTCVAALVGEGLSFFMQVGDGDLVASAAGGELTRPMPDDEGLTGEQTYSICLPDAVALFRTLLFQAPHPLARPDFVAVSSDGLSKSFANVADFLSMMREWRRLAENGGFKALEPRLEGWLSDCSSQGSGDDVSLAIYVARLDARSD